MVALNRDTGIVTSAKLIWPFQIALIAGHCSRVDRLECPRGVVLHQSGDFVDGHIDVAGLTLSGLSPDGSLVEIVELQTHPWFIGCQFHPELQSRPTRPHPLFASFIGAAFDTKKQRAERKQAALEKAQ